jgi:LPXTG-site transpeptidase (sortase) family protein
VKRISSSQIIAIGTLFILCGIIIFSSQYILEKRDSLFEYINMQLYFDQMNSVVPDEPVEPDSPVEPTDPEVDPDDPSEPEPIYENFVAVLEIPKIDLKRGLYDVESKYNNVNRNIMILSPSQYPDVENGNFILAAHSGSGYISFFRNLYKLSTGDYAYVYYNNVKYSYEITNIYYQQKTGKIAVYRPQDKNTLMLITCTKNDESTQTVYVAELRGTEQVEGY